MTGKVEKDFSTRKEDSHNPKKFLNMAAKAQKTTFSLEADSERDMLLANRIYIILLEKKENLHSLRQKNARIRELSPRDLLENLAQPKQSQFRGSEKESLGVQARKKEQKPQRKKSKRREKEEQKKLRIPKRRY